MGRKGSRSVVRIVFVLLIKGNIIKLSVILTIFDCQLRKQFSLGFFIVISELITYFIGAFFFPSLSLY